MRLKGGRISGPLFFGSSGYRRMEELPQPRPLRSSPSPRPGDQRHSDRTQSRFGSCPLSGCSVVRSPLGLFLHSRDYVSSLGEITMNEKGGREFPAAFALSPYFFLVPVPES